MRVGVRVGGGVLAVHLKLYSKVIFVLNYNFYMLSKKEGVGEGGGHNSFLIQI